MTLVNGTIYLDSQMSIQTNPIIFFVSVVIFPITLAAIANRTEGGSFTEMLGFSGKPIFALSMVLMGIGTIGLLFFTVTRPLSILFKGTSLYSAFTFMYLPLSAKPLWFLSFTPLLGLVFYLTIAFGEEIMKIFCSKNIANWIFEKTNGKGKGWVITMGFAISLLGWLFCHWNSWGGVPLMGVLMGMGLSVVFVSPLFFAEPLLSPEKGFQLTSFFNIWAPMAGHLGYDFLLSMMTEGSLIIGMGEGIMLSFVIFIAGGSILAYQYYQRRGITGIFKL